MLPNTILTFNIQDSWSIFLSAVHFEFKGIKVDTVILFFSVKN